MPQPKGGRGGRGREGSDPDLTPDPVAPPAGEEPGRMIVGIVGESEEDGAIRVYLDVEFSKSYDIPADAILRREQLEPQASPLGIASSAVWVRTDTPLKLRQTKTRRVEDEFLAGDFTAPGSFEPLPDAVLGRQPIQITLLTRQIRCSWNDACPTGRGCSEIGPCGTRLSLCFGACESRVPRPCGESIGIACTVFCPSRRPPCRVTFGLRCESVGRCPSAFDACPSALACPQGGGFDPGDPFEF